MLGDTPPLKPHEMPQLERRERHVTMMLAYITLDDGERISCVIRDLSYGGAKLGVARRYRLPEQFNLTIPNRDLTFQVDRVWQRGDFAGVKLPLDEAGTGG